MDKEGEEALKLLRSSKPFGLRYLAGFREFGKRQARSAPSITHKSQEWVATT